MLVSKRILFEIGDIQLPDDDLVQCGSEFCAICNVDTEKCLSVVTEVLGRKNVCFEIFAIIQLVMHGTVSTMMMKL